MIQTLKRLVLRSVPTSISECRNCGTSVGLESESCPECGSSEIASYEIEN
jgi:anaerobic ribonucleoside-triphosphate reductase